jgi:hypothetical protein
MLVFPARSFLYDRWATPKACGKVNLPALTNPITGIVIALDDCTKAVTNASEKKAFNGVPVNLTKARRNAAPAKDFKPPVSSTMPIRRRPIPRTN